MSEVSVLDELGPSADTRMAPIDRIVVGDNVRDVREENVVALVEAIRASGKMFHPLAVDEYLVLIDGQHRLEAAKRLGWSEVEVKIIPNVGTPEIRAMLQFMANSVRARVTPREAARYLPEYRAFVAADRDRKKRSGVGAVDKLPDFPDGSTAGMTMDDLGASSGRTADVIRATLGYSVDDLEHYREIEQLAATYPNDEVRDAANDGLQAIDSGVKPIAPVWKHLADVLDRVEADPEALLVEQRAAESKAKWNKIEGFRELCEQLGIGDLTPVGGTPENVVLVLREVASAVARLVARCERDAGLDGATDDQLNGGRPRYAQL